MGWGRKRGRSWARRPISGSSPHGMLTSELRYEAHARMLNQEVEPRFDLLPGGGGEQLFGVGAVGEGRLLEAEERFPH